MTDQEKERAGGAWEQQGNFGSSDGAAGSGSAAQPMAHASTASTSGGKRNSGSGSGSGSRDPSPKGGRDSAKKGAGASSLDRAGTSHGRHRQRSERDRAGSEPPLSDTEIFAMDPREIRTQTHARAATSHSGKRYAAAGEGGLGLGKTPGILEAADSAASLLGPAPDQPPRSAVSRRRSRAGPVDHPGRGLDSGLSLDAFSNQTRKELEDGFDTGVLSNGSRIVNGFVVGDVDGSSSPNTRAVRKTLGGYSDVTASSPTRPALQRGGSYKGNGSFRGHAGGGAQKASGGAQKSSRDAGEGGAVSGFPSGQRPVAGAGAGMGMAGGTSKDHQRNAHMSALRKQTSWTKRASPAPSPKAEPAGAFSFLTSLGELFGGGRRVDPEAGAGADGAPAADAAAGGYTRGDSSLTAATRQMDGSDYTGSNRPRDNLAPSERLQQAISRRQSEDASESSHHAGSQGPATPDTSVIIYPKPPAGETMHIPRFRLSEGQKSLEKRLLMSNAEAMRKYPGKLDTAACMHAYIHTCIHTYIHACIHIHIHIHTCVGCRPCGSHCTHACMRARMRAYMHVCVHICMCACMYACVRAYMHVCVHICMYAAPSSASNRPPLSLSLSLPLSLSFSPSLSRRATP
jgi:hypothetical protein